MVNVAPIRVYPTPIDGAMVNVAPIGTDLAPINVAPIWHRSG
jgi:hypothetical protein